MCVAPLSVPGMEVFELGTGHLLCRCLLSQGGLAGRAAWVCTSPGPLAGCAPAELDADAPGAFGGLVRTSPS